MKSILTFLASMLAVVSLQAQQPFPTASENPTWRMSTASTIQPPTPRNIQLGQDTLFCGETWNPILESDSLGTLVWQLGYVRQQGQKVYVRSTADCSAAEYLMYDFSVEVGDTVVVGHSPFGNITDDVLTFVLDVGSETYLGTERKTILLYFYDSWSGGGFLQWIDGVGAAQHPFYSLVDLSGFSEVFFSFHCLETADGLQYVAPGGQGVCDSDNLGVKYVNVNVSGGNNDGTSWANAYHGLQDALAVANYGDSIWVAVGTYYPTDGTDRSVSFVLPNGVTLLGGFNGTETAASQRDVAFYPTILSGDIGMPGDSIDNSYHVVYTLGTDGNSILDGFTVEEGNADHPDWNSHFRNGGGLCVDTDEDHLVTKPIIRNCRFRNNFARRGGAIYCNGENTGTANPSIEGCYFGNNRAAGEGGAVYKNAGLASSSLFLISNSTFENNFALSGGGAVYFRDVEHPVKFESCTFNNNSSLLDGGAIFHYFLSTNGNLEFENCFFIKNMAPSGGGVGVLCNGLNSSTESNYAIKILNSEFSENQATTNQGGAVRISYLGDHQSTIEISETIFTNNACLNGGAAINIHNDSSTHSHHELRIQDCKFTGNDVSLANAGGGIYYQAFPGQDQFYTDIINTEFQNNTGAMAFIFGGEEGAVKTNVTNCSFLNNGAYPFIKNYSPDFNDGDFYNTMNITNCIVQEYAPVHRMFYNNDPNSFSINNYHIRHSLINAPDCIVNGTDGCGEGVLYQLDPLFLDTLSELSLANCSPAINAGQNLAIDTLGVPFDLQGNDRIQENAVDMGAHETPSFLAGPAVVTPESCESGMDGSILIATNGTQPLTYFWENGGSSGTAPDSLSAGDYLFTVTDGFGCTDTFSVEIGRIVDMELTYTILNASEFDTPDGLIAIGAIAGGTAPYSLVWENGDTLFFRQNLLAGIYSATITDANGCTFSQNFTVSAPNAVSTNWLNTPSLTIFPNPNNGRFLARFETAKGGIYGMTVFDMLGKAVTFPADSWFDGGATHKIPLDISELPDGNYWLEMRSEQGRAVQRFVKQG